MCVFLLPRRKINTYLVTLPHSFKLLTKCQHSVAWIGFINNRHCFALPWQLVMTLRAHTVIPMHFCALLSVWSMLLSESSHTHRNVSSKILFLIWLFHPIIVSCHGRSDLAYGTIFFAWCEITIWCNDHEHNPCQCFAQSGYNWMYSC